MRTLSKQLKQMGQGPWEELVTTAEALEAKCDRYREALEWITRNLTDACTDLNGNIAELEECEGCKLTIQEVIHRATNALKGA